MTSMRQEAGCDARSERGQTMAEYAAVLAVITVAIVAAYGSLLPNAIQRLLERITGVLS